MREIWRSAAFDTVVILPLPSSQMDGSTAHGLPWTSECIADTDKRLPDQSPGQSPGVSLLSLTGPVWDAAAGSPGVLAGYTP